MLLTRSFLLNSLTRLTLLQSQLTQKGNSKMVGLQLQQVSLEELLFLIHMEVQVCMEELSFLEKIHHKYRRPQLTIADMLLKAWSTISNVSELWLKLFMLQDSNNHSTFKLTLIILQFKEMMLPCLN